MRHRIIFEVLDSPNSSSQMENSKRPSMFLNHRFCSSIIGYSYSFVLPKPSCVHEFQEPHSQKKPPVIQHKYGKTPSFMAIPTIDDILFLSIFHSYARNYQRVHVQYCYNHMMIYNLKKYIHIYIYIYMCHGPCFMA